MGMYRKTAVVIIAWVLGHSACGGDGSNTSSNIWCEGLCSAVQRCGVSQNERTCKSMCVLGRPGLENISTRGAAALAPCVSELSCVAVSGDEARWDSELDACWDEAKLRVEPTSRVRDVCQTLAQRDFECGYWFATDTCEGVFGMWADDVLDGVSLCEGKVACAERDACITAVFDNL
jgi:hypothetical protein